jgi:hypothetical protein
VQSNFENAHQHAHNPNAYFFSVEDEEEGAEVLQSPHIAAPAAEPENSSWESFFINSGLVVPEGRQKHPICSSNAKKRHPFRVHPESPVPRSSLEGASSVPTMRPAVPQRHMLNPNRRFWLMSRY